jgi:hypothetical protein
LQHRVHERFFEAVRGRQYHMKIALLKNQHSRLGQGIQQIKRAVFLSSLRIGVENLLALPSDET